MKMNKDEEKFFNDNVIDFNEKKIKKKARKMLDKSKLYSLRPNKEVIDQDLDTTGYRYWFPKVSEVRVSSVATRLIDEAHTDNSDEYMMYLMHMMNIGCFGITDQVEDSRNMFAIAHGGVVTGKYPYDPDMDRDKVGEAETLIISISKCRTMCFVAMESEIEMDDES
jgi:hypothetical protein|tara:strand:+ start:73 stop:573 length:501 start_codon:yes stop_codon:yes gene_type:complete